jgi:hypothetical protein
MVISTKHHYKDKWGKVRRMAKAYGVTEAIRSQCDHFIGLVQVDIKKKLVEK